MGELQNIGIYSETFEYLQEQVVYFEENLKNTLFDQDDDEDDRKAYKRGETIYDKLHESLVNIKDILTKKNEIIEFLNRCEQNQRIFEIQENELINKLMRIKKRFASKEEYYNARDEWNARRNETPDERNRRECEEMLIEIKEEKILVTEERRKTEELYQQIKREREQLPTERMNRIEEKSFIFIQHKIIQRQIKKINKNGRITKYRNIFRNIQLSSRTSCLF